jgi:two-component system nitrate/nitrite sensor histidine kinase NarX
VAIAHDVTAHRQLERQVQAHIAQAATEAERARLARELHDTVTQELYSASLLAQTLPRLWAQQPAAVERSLGHLHEITQSGLATMRLLLLELRPDGLEAMTLPTLLQLLQSAMRTRASVPLVLDIAGDEDGWALVPQNVKQAFYRMAQEAVTNAVKYASASQMAVRLRRGRRGSLHLEIVDDGVGFDPHRRSPKGHFGLTIMRERAQAIGAAMRVVSQVGQGTRVVIHWKGTESVPEVPSAVHVSAEEARGEESRP